jgi:hypothetical protein
VLDDLGLGQVLVPKEPIRLHIPTSIWVASSSVGVAPLYCSSYITMVSKKFYLCGDGVSTALELDISAVQTFDELQRSVAAFYGIVQPDGVAFQAGESELEELAAITGSEEPVGITVGGHSVREVPGPQGLPYIGNYFEGEL